MPLPPGTALQNGHYVIDALLEAAPNGNLYWGTHVVTGMRVYIQVFTLATHLDDAAIAALVTRLEGLSFAPETPLPNPFQIFHEAGQTLCLAISATLGLPWSQYCRTHEPLPPKQALAAVRTIANGVLWLDQQDLGSLDLAANRIWIVPDSDRLLLTGLPQHFLATDPAMVAPGDSVSALATLLWSFLMGTVPPPAMPTEERLQALRQQHPQLSPLIQQAIQQGLTPSDTARDLQQWLATLPDHPHVIATQVVAPARPTPPPAQPRPARSPRRSGKPTYIALGITALVAAIAGTTLGTVWRLNAATLPGKIQFDPHQSFPPQADWQGDQPDAAFEQPYTPAPSHTETWLRSTSETTLPDRNSVVIPESPASDGASASDNFPGNDELVPLDMNSDERGSLNPDPSSGDDADRTPTDNTQTPPPQSPRSEGDNGVSANSTAPDKVSPPPVPEVAPAPAPTSDS